MRDWISDKWARFKAWSGRQWARFKVWLYGILVALGFAGGHCPG